MSPTARAALRGIGVVVLLPFILIGLLMNIDEDKKEKFLSFFRSDDDPDASELDRPSGIQRLRTSVGEIVGTAVKGLLAILFFPLSPLVLFFVGLNAKHKQAAFEGVLYTALLAFALWLPTSVITGFLGVGAVAAGIIRLFQFKELWLTKKSRSAEVVASRTPGSIETEPVKDPIDVARGLSTDLGRLSAKVRRNKHHLPGDAYITFLECHQTLDSVVDAEKQTPSIDPQFRYELDAMVTDYLPSVLMNYLAIPADMKDRPLPGGKTADEELIEQLGLLQAQAESLYSSRHGKTSAKLADSGNFLREKFGHHKQDQFDFGIS